MDIDVSIVVPAYHGARTIAACLESILAAALGTSREVIVVESSGDETAEIVGRQFASVRVILPEQQLSAGAARNRGAAASRGRIVCFVDQDCIVPTDWIRNLRSLLEDVSVAGAGGSVGIADPENVIGSAVYFLEFLTHFPRRGPPRRNANFLLGCNCCYRAEVIRAHPFPDQTIGEDIVHSHKIREAGHDLVYAPAIEVRHVNRRGWGKLISYNRRLGRSAVASNAATGRWHLPIFRRVPMLAFVSPLIILPTIAWRISRSRWLDFARFLAIMPMCLVGNVAWATAYRRELLEERRRRSSPERQAA